MACVVAREPKNFPCDTCDCIEGRQPTGGRWRIPDAKIITEVCPRQQLSQFSLQMLEMYRHYEQGLLPEAGGLLDQPTAYLRAMSVIDSWMKRPNG
jgi:hypothetical protein